MGSGTNRQAAGSAAALIVAEAGEDRGSGGRAEEGGPGEPPLDAESSIFGLLEALLQRAVELGHVAVDVQARGFWVLCAKSWATSDRCVSSPPCAKKDEN